jgi:hypothetical protein
MSKKLIAVAAAAALALTALVAVPANSAAITSVAVVHGATPAATGDGGTTATLLTSQTDSDAALAAATSATSRTVIFGNSTDTATRTAVRATVTTASAATVTVTSTLGVKISASTTDAAGLALSVTAGSQLLTATTSDGAPTYVFYAWNTSTTAGSVVVDTGDSKLTFYVKGLIGPEAYNLTNVTFPTSLYIGQTTATVTFKVSDMYGNAITTGTGVQPTGFGASFAAATYSATTLLWSSAISAIVGDNVAINVAIAPTDLSANGFAAPVKSVFKLITAGDLSVQVTALTAQVTALTAQVVALTADYNRLATRFNKRYDLKKAPVKKVALK